MNFFEKEMRQMFDDEDIFQDAKFVGKTMLAGGLAARIVDGKVPAWLKNAGV